MKIFLFAIGLVFFTNCSAWEVPQKQQNQISSQSKDIKSKPFQSVEKLMVGVVGYFTLQAYWELWFNK